MQLRKLWLNINGADRMVVCEPRKGHPCRSPAPPRSDRRKDGRGIGVCGVCSVLLDGKVVKACVKKMKSIPEFSKIVTIEGVGTPMHLHPLQQAFITYGRRPVRLLHPRLYRLRLRPAPAESESDARGRACVVQKESQLLPLHRL